MSTPPAKRMIRSIGAVSLMLVLSRVLGYVREALLAARFGATHTTDAYLVGQDISTSVAVAAGLIMVLIPVYKEAVQQRGRQAAWQLINSVLNVTFMVMAVLVAVVWLVVPSLVPRLVPGLPQDILDLAIGLTRIMLPTLILSGIGGVAMAAHNANEQFMLPGIASVIGNATVVATLAVVSGGMQIRWVAWSVFAGTALGTGVLLAWLVRIGFRYRLAIDWQDPLLKRVGRLILPAMVTIGVAQLHNLVDRFLASYLPPGSISALNYAVLLNSLPYGVVGVAIVTVLYPNLAEHVAAGRWDDLRRTLTNGLQTMSFVLLPMAVGLVLFREPIVRMLFQRGVFDPKATVGTAYALQFYAIGILFWAWADLFNRCFFATQDTWTPMWSAIGTLLVHLGFNLVLVRPLGHGGLALGTSLSAIFSVSFLAWRLRRHVGAFPLLPVLRSVGVNLCTAVVGAAAGYGVFMVATSVWPMHSFVGEALRLGVGLATLVAVHVGLAVLLGRPEGMQVLSQVGQLIWRRAK